MKRQFFSLIISAPVASDEEQYTPQEVTRQIQRTGWKVEEIFRDAATPQLAEEVRRLHLQDHSYHASLGGQPCRRCEALGG